MVDNALERPDIALSKRGTIELNKVPLRALRSFFLTQNRVAGPVSFNRVHIKILLPTDGRTDKKTPPHLWALNFKDVDFCESLQVFFFKLGTTF